MENNYRESLAPDKFIEGVPKEYQRVVLDDKTLTELEKVGDRCQERISLDDLASDEKVYSINQRLEETNSKLDHLAKKINQMKLSDTSKEKYSTKKTALI